MVSIIEMLHCYYVALLCKFENRRVSSGVIKVAFFRVLYIERERVDSDSL